MLQNEDLDSLDHLSTNVNAKQKKIWELQQHHICMTKEIEKMSIEIVHMRKRTQQLEEEDGELESLSVQLGKSIELQQSAIPIDNQITTYLDLYKQLLKELNIKFEDNCSSTLSKCENYLNEYRQNYEKQSLYYKQLHFEKIRLKQLQIQKMWLITQIKQHQKQQQLFENIQMKKFQSNIIKLAQYYVNYKKYERNFFNLQKMKEEEQILLKEHLKLQESVKELSRKKIIKPKNVSNLNKRKSDDGDAYGDAERFQDKYQEFTQTLRGFLSNEFKPNISASVPQTPQLKNFSNNNQKVQILDVQIMNPSKKHNDNLNQNKTPTISSTNIKPNNNENPDWNKKILKTNHNKTQKVEQSKPLEKKPIKQEILHVTSDHKVKLSDPPKPNEKKPIKQELHHVTPDNNVKLYQEDKRQTELKEKSKESSLIKFEQQLAKFTDKVDQSKPKTDNKNLNHLKKQQPTINELNQSKILANQKRVSFKIDDDNTQKSSSQTDTDNNDSMKSQSTQNISTSDNEQDLNKNKSIFNFGQLNAPQMFSNEKTVAKEKQKVNDIFKYPLDDSDPTAAISTSPEDAIPGASADEDPFMFNASFGATQENAPSSTNLPFSFGQPQKSIFQLF